MKRKYLFTSLVLAALAFTACKDKPTTPSSGAQSSDPQTGDTGSTEKPDVVPVAPMPSSASVEDRAAKLGFAKHLPGDIVIYDAVFNGRKAFDKLVKSSLGEFIVERMADEGMSLDMLEGNDEAAAQIAIYSEEYFSAYGKGTSEAFDLSMKFFERLGFYGARVGVFMGDGVVREGGDFSPRGPAPFMDGPLKGAPKELVKMFSDFEMPCFYQGSKVSDPESRELVTAQMEQVVSMLGFAEDASEAITIKRGDAEFSGYKISGAKLAEMIDDDAVDEMKEVFEIADIEAFKKSLASKNIVGVTGVVDDYVILFFGKSEEDLVLVDDVADSICASDDIVYLDPYLGKDLLTVSFRDAKVVQAVGSIESIGYRILSSTVRGVSEGLGDAASLGDTQDIEAILDSIDEQGSKLASMFSGTDAGYVAYLEEGLKVEGFGGSNLPSFDFEKSHSLSPLASGDGMLLFANWTSNEAYNEKVMEYVDSLGEAGYLLVKRVAALDLEDNDFNEFKQGIDLFDRSFRDDALEIWQALRGDMAAGLGAESALVVDVNGSLPKVPQVPKMILEQGKMPRISYVSAVADRAKLQTSWKRLNESAENILKAVSEMVGNEIPMQVPMSSEKNDLKTWFIPIPFQNDDFVPSVSVSDELFFVSTSKAFSEGLAEQFKQGGGDPRKGAWLHVDFKVLHHYAQQWLDLVEGNLDELARSESAREDFTENKPMIEEAMKAFGSLDDLTLHARNEGGRSRISLHLKVK
ncbi:MAG: hypothetical protein KJO21_02985 [Verrucomicrobiae bacterium]|nr:hypothetical protein [Verrucomicrobiae bacterium]NNJ41883.1 hypothetical protein [Akkermansiaceae bacterium]